MIAEIRFYGLLAEKCRICVSVLLPVYFGIKKKPCRQFFWNWGGAFLWNSCSRKCLIPLHQAFFDKVLPFPDKCGTVDAEAFCGGASVFIFIERLGNIFGFYFFDLVL